jgi:translation elongation factor EF-Tu-like GTPase
MENKGTPVTMRMSDNTIERIEVIRNISGETNRTRIVACSIESFKYLLEETKKGSKIIFEKKDGTKESVNFIGLG